MNQQTLSSLIWSVADLLRGDFKQSEYGRVNLPFTVLRSWFRSLSDLRNLCAHHMRVWNREFGSHPIMPKRPPRDWPAVPKFIPCGSPSHPEQALRPQRRLYMQVVVIESLMRIVCPESRWAERLLRLLDALPEVSRPHMRFPAGWEQ